MSKKVLKIIYGCLVVIVIVVGYSIYDFYSPVLVERSSIMISRSDHGTTILENSRYNFSIDLGDTCVIDTEFFNYIAKRRFVSELDCDNYGRGITLSVLDDSQYRYDDFTEVDVTQELVSVHKNEDQGVYIIKIRNEAEEKYFRITVVSEDFVRINKLLTSIKRF